MLAKVNSSGQRLHVLDAARLFRLALEKAPAGSRLHTAGDQGIPLKEIAETIGKKMGVPVKSIPAEEAWHFGFLSRFVLNSMDASAEVTKAKVGWEPREIGLIEDLQTGKTSSDG